MKKLSESIWSDIRKRGNGTDVKQEDTFNPEYVDFGENTTVYWAVESLEIDDENKFYFDEVEDYNNNGWRLPTIEEVKQLDWSHIRVSWYDGYKHIKFQGGDELKINTADYGFHIWTSESDPKFKNCVYSYGCDNMGHFDIDSTNKGINRLYVFLVKDK